ncbi:S-adenosyl-L-methionine-dependent methyltransferase [Agrocybe pediades]|nr:S-adenosyl-L-methionine-dependent methyltransferase [Agrocybe pediades]
MTTYLGGLLPSPLELGDTRKVLELGSGSGAWAIQAAREFPDAEVLAVDLNPLPTRSKPLPPNLTFQKVDLTETLPFEKETFDIVHARFVMMHLAHGHEVFRKCFDLVRPGGWLVVEEPDLGAMADGGKALPPKAAEFLQQFIKIMHSRNADPTVGKYMEQMLKDSELFDVVNIKKLCLPYSQKSNDPNENAIGGVFRRTLLITSTAAGERLASEGLTEAIAKNFIEVLYDEERSITSHLYFSWSRKRA